MKVCKCVCMHACVHTAPCSRLVTMVTKISFMQCVSDQAVTSCYLLQRMGHCVYGVWPAVKDCH